jgi:hypothetical protein
MACAGSMAGSTPGLSARIAADSALTASRRGSCVSGLAADIVGVVVTEHDEGRGLRVRNACRETMTDWKELANATVMLLWTMKGKTLEHKLSRFPRTNFILVAAMRTKTNSVALIRRVAYQVVVSDQPEVTHCEVTSRSILTRVTVDESTSVGRPLGGTRG